MALGERFRSGGARGIAQFLAEHERCDAGFDVHRDEGLGSGKLRIACLGCGRTIDYRAAEAGELAAAGMSLSPAEANGGTEAAAPPPAPLPQRQPAQVPPERYRRPMQQPRRRPPRRAGIPRWLVTGLIVLLILGGLTMIAIGLLRDGDQQTATTTGPAAETQTSAPSAPAQTGAPQQQPEQQGTAQEGTASTGTQTGLQTRRFANRFAIGVPPGWQDGSKDGAITLIAPGSTAEIDVFFEAGARSPGEMAAATPTFLQQRHAGAQVSDSEPFRLGPMRALRIRATYPGGAEHAVVISAHGYSYLVLRRVDRGASDDLEQQADSALVTFRPL